MCGLAGIIDSSPRQDSLEILAEFGRSLEHRGPDDSGFLSWDGKGQPVVTARPCGLTPGRVAFAHRRLSILDLSEAGRQPMASPDKRYVIIFNGEIYNYLELRKELEKKGISFSTGTDTEVLLAAYMAWREKALTRLVGMFAFAILDTVERSIFLARDFFGMKPLYYTHHGDRFAFASEIKTLLKLPGFKPRAQSQRLYDYLRFGRSDMGGATLFEGIEQFPAAHYMKVSIDRPRDATPVHYWQPAISERQDITFDEAADHLRTLFLDSVSMHLRSDVPVGAALSGGIDSSSTVMAMRRLAGNDREIHTFSFAADDKKVSEERWIDTVSAAANTISHKVRLRPQDLSNDLDHLIGIQDEPFATTSIYAMMGVYRMARDNGIKVTLDGQGADEFLAGYPTYIAARMASLMRQGKFSNILHMVHSASLTGGVSTPGLFLRAGSMFLPPALHGMARQISGHDYSPAWMNRQWFHGQEVIPPTPHASGRGGQILHEQLRQTLMENSLPALLRYVDRNAMAYSVESRLPFLTPDLVNFVFSLPEHFIIDDNGVTKAVFRRAMRGIVPDSILDRRDKIGFVTPEGAWLQSLKGWAENILTSEAAAAIPAIHLPEINKFWKKTLSGNPGNDNYLWRCLNLIRWTEIHGVSFGK